MNSSKKAEAELREAIRKLETFLQEKCEEMESALEPQKKEKTV